MGENEFIVFCCCVLAFCDEIKWQTRMNYLLSESSIMKAEKWAGNLMIRDSECLQFQRNTKQYRIHHPPTINFSSKYEPEQCIHSMHLNDYHPCFVSENNGLLLNATQTSLFGQSEPQHTHRKKECHILFYCVVVNKEEMKSTALITH